MNAESIKKIYQRFAAANPNPTTELKYNNEFELLIAVMLSAQATDISVNKATGPLFKIANTPEKIFALGLDNLKRYIKTIGLYNAKAKNIINTCRILIEEHNSNVPNSREALERLPGVGRKTANVVLNALFGENAIAVDTHIFRVANRTKMAVGKTPLEVEKKLTAATPKKYLKNAHFWLVLHGRYTCKARTPLCKICIINDLCEYPDKNL